MNIKDAIYEIKNRTIIEDIISEYVKLKKVGKGFVGLCPFHHEKTPSFYVTPDKGIYHCFGCGKSGDVFTFLMEIEKISFMEAVRKLANRVGFNFDSVLNKGSEITKTLISNLKQINIEAQKFFTFYLTKGDKTKDGINYLKSRGINQNIAKKFKFGMAPKAKDALYKYLKSKFFTDETIFESKLVVNTPNKPIDLFRYRITLPIENEYGDIIGFAGRTLSQEEKAKYINLPETPLFKKRNILFGFNHAKNKIKDTKRAFLVEGYFDVISLHKHEIENVCGVMGTSLTSEQIKLIDSISDKLYLFFDSDNAGINSIQRAIPLILTTSNLEVKIVKVNQKDPDEFVKYCEANGEVIDESILIKNSYDIIDFLLLKNLELIKYGEKNTKMSFLLEIFKIISLMKNLYDKEESLRKVSEAMNISETIIKSEFEKYQKHQRVTTENITTSYIKLSNPDIELAIAYMITKDNKLLDTLKAEIDLEDIKNDTIKAYFSFLEEYINNEEVDEKDVNTLYLLQSEIENKASSIVKVFSENLKDDFEFLITVYKIRKINERKKEIQNIIERISKESEDNEIIEELLEEKHLLTLEEKKIKESRKINY